MPFKWEKYIGEMAGEKPMQTISLSENRQKATAKRKRV